jgi:AP endonuclease-2
VVDFGSFVLFNLYVPATCSDDEVRVAFKLDFLTAVEIRYRALMDAGRRVVLCGRD